jgi:hypothetical protein
MDLSLREEGCYVRLRVFRNLRLLRDDPFQHGWEIFLLA